MSGVNLKGNNKQKNPFSRVPGNNGRGLKELRKKGLTLEVFLFDFFNKGQALGVSSALEGGI
jgi:hypothetical protein